MNIAYLAPYNDGTGYSHAAIGTMLGLNKAGTNIFPREAKLANQVVLAPSIIQDRSRAKITDDIDVHISHTLPPAFIASDRVKNIGYFHIETTNFKNSNWQFHANIMDEIWVCSYENKLACQDSGVKVPIKIVPIPADLDIYKKGYTPIYKNKNEYVFYSIGDWSERKNMRNLIKAFLIAFGKRDDVVLLLKCYAEGHSSHQSRELISQEINSIKEDLRKGDNYPKIRLITEYLTDEQIYQIHAAGDCYVTTERAAAWNIPAFDAFAFNKPIIANGWGGQTQFLTDSNPDIMLLEYKMTYVSGMNLCPYKTMYTCHEQWADPFLDHIVEAMRYMYNYQYEANKDHRDYILQDFSLERAGQTLKEILQ